MLYLARRYGAVQQLKLSYLTVRGWHERHKGEANLGRSMRVESERSRALSQLLALV